MGNSERQWRTIVPVRCPHNTRDENKAIKAGEVPEDWADKPAMPPCMIAKRWITC